MASGCEDIFLNTLKFFYYFNADIYDINKQTSIRPIGFFYEKYFYLGQEKWEIYAEVTRKIFCEIGGIKEWAMDIENLINMGNL